MHSRHTMWSLISGVLLTIALISPAFAEGSFDIPAGAHFNQQKLQRIGEFLRGEIADGKIPGAIVLIQQHGQAGSITSSSACAISRPNRR